MVKEIAIYGAGGFGREVKMLIRQINEKKAQFNMIGFFDDNMKAGMLINDSPVIGGLRQLNELKTRTGLVIAIGDPHTKKKILQQIKNSYIFYPQLIHPSCLIGEYNTIGEGVIICAGNIITVNCRIGNHVTLNLNCTVGHDSNLGHFCSVMPGVNVSGEVSVNEGVYIGTGAKINNQVEIGDNCIIGAGAVVINSFPPDTTAVGIPAKALKSKTNGEG